MNPWIEELTELLTSVRLELITSSEGYVIGYEKERHGVGQLPFAGLDEQARRAELLAIAAGVDAAIKSPAEFQPGESFVDAAPALFPKLERKRFVQAYNSVVDGRGGRDAEKLIFTDVGADLVTCYVSDEQWRVRYVTEEQRQGWDVSVGTVDSAARSHLYARAELYDDDQVVNVGDYFDAARVTIVGDRYFQRDTGHGIVCAVPGRDVLLVGPDAATEAEVLRRYEASAYPICPYVLRFRRGGVERLTDAVPQR